MVKGISKQVIVLQAPETRMFEQAIFILKDGATAVSDKDLYDEARRIFKAAAPDKRRIPLSGFAWASGGALFTGAIWLLCQLVG